ncbi:MAG TPA: CtsR family transcriptional regulator [Firmicutes bacterium]|nr:CtsR family transcriptional regulator [Candidatus Fermentithermobacillaceae bacterium]
MASLADHIERYIESLIAEGEGVAEIQRALIAELFRCAPSQVTYVITSRFSPERGYIIESRRGGGGFIRVTKVSLNPERVRDVLNDVGSHLSQGESYAYLERLREEGHLDERTYAVMRAALSRNALTIGLPDRDLLRANIFKAMLNAYFSVEQRESEGT